MYGVVSCVVAAGAGSPHSLPLSPTSLSRPFRILISLLRRLSTELSPRHTVLLDAIVIR